MTIKDLTNITRIHRIVIKTHNHPVNVIDLTSGSKVVDLFNSEYINKEVDEINPYIESKIDRDGELRAKPKLEVVIYE